MRRFQFFTDNCRKVICVTHYKGKPIRGVAKCSPNDTFDFEKGKLIAEGRCKEKLEKKRLIDAEKRYHKILEEKRKIQRRFEKACKDLTSSSVAHEFEKHSLEIFLEDLK